MGPLLPALVVVSFAASERPQIMTTARLVKLGESITLTLAVPDGLGPGDVRVFPRYLERATPGDAFAAGGTLDWLEALPSEELKPTFVDGSGELAYTPREPGSYLLWWRVVGETLYRYFAVVEDDWVVLRFSAFDGLEPEPTLHATGIPLDYRLPAGRFDQADALCVKLAEYERTYGDQVIPHLPDTPALSHEERLREYGAALARVRELMPDESSVRSVRLEHRHDLDPGYIADLEKLGVVDQCGLWEANAKPWLGMPEFPYFASPVDCRKVDQRPKGAVVAHQWDFCGGWHFIGPVSRHFKAAEGDWPTAERCVAQGAAELANAATLSGHPVFAVPLYDGLVGPGYPNPSFTYGVPDSRQWIGDVDDVLVVPRALTEDEVRRAMGEGAGSVAGAVAAWGFDGGTAASSEPEAVGPVEWTQGPRGKAASLREECAFLRTESPLALDSDAFTIGLWVRPAAKQRTWANIVSSHNNDGATGLRGVSIEQAGDLQNAYYLIVGVGDRWVGTDVVTQLQPEQWQHFAVVRDGTTITHYLNGSVSATGKVPDTKLSRATDLLRIGQWARGDVGQDDRMPRFVDRYQRFVAFELPKRHKLAFARSVDIADYYVRHFHRTPRTVFVSSSDHLLYDMWWLCTWGGQGILVPRERIPWETRVSSVLAQRDAGPGLKDPLSSEYILVEDQKRSVRFERECPNPIWWFDYTHQEVGPGGSAITHTRTPDVTVSRPLWVPEPGDRLRADLRLTSTEPFEDYMIALWGLPDRFDPVAPIRSNAKDHIVARNLDGEYHLVLVFDLRPETRLWVSVGESRR